MPRHNLTPRVVARPRARARPRGMLERDARRARRASATA